MRVSILALFFIFGILYSCQEDFSTTAAYDQGHEIYLAHCVSCHGIDGDGNNIIVRIDSKKSRVFGPIYK